MPENERRVNMCEVCRKIDFLYLSEHPRAHVMDAAHYSFPLVYTPDCELCNILTPGSMTGDKAELTSYNFLEDCSWTDVFVDEFAFPSVALGVDHDYSSRDTIFYIPSQHLEERPVLWKPRPLSDTPDYVAARAWLHDCQNHHGLGCDDSFRSFIDGLHLIDVHESKIVDATGLENPRWVALSCVY